MHVKQEWRGHPMSDTPEWKLVESWLESGWRLVPPQNDEFRVVTPELFHWGGKTHLVPPPTANRRVVTPALYKYN